MGFLRAFIVLLMIFVASSVPSGFSQSTPDIITNEIIEDRIASISADETINEEQKSAAIDLLNRAKATLLIVEQRAIELEESEAASRSLGDALANIAARRLEIDRAQDETENLESIAELDSRLSVMEAERQLLSDRLSDLRSESINLSNRAELIADEVIAARSEAGQLAEATGADTPRSEAPLEEANWLLARASLQERLAAITHLQRELETLPARQSLVDARINLVEAQISRIDQAVSRVRVRLSESALWQADIAIREAEAEALELDDTVPELRALAGANLDLANEWRNSILRRGVLERQIVVAEQEVDALQQSADTVRLVLGAGRLSDETAALLNTVRSSLANKAEINASLFRSESQSGDVRLQLIVWLDALSGLESVRPSQRRSPETTGLDAASDVRERLLEFKQNTLELLINGARQESELLSEHQLALRELSQKSSELSSELDRRFLWLRTSERANWSWLAQIPNGIAWILSASSWAGVVEAIYSGTSANLGVTGLFALLMIVLWSLRRWLLRTLDGLAKNVGHVGHDTYLKTPLALAVTVLIALPVPLAVSFAGWLISDAGSEPRAFAQGLGQTLALLGPVLFVLCFFQEMCRPKGLFDAHFNWTEKARTRLLANLNWFVRVETGAIVFFGLTVFSGPPEIAYGVGVMAFVVGSLALAFLTFQFLKPKGGIVSQLKIGASTSLFLKILLPFAVLEPLIVGVLPFFGFFDTAMQLQFLVLQSGALILAGSVFYGLAVRMFMVGNRRLALEKAREKRNRIEAARATESELEASGEKHGLDKDQSITDADQIGEQMSAVFRLATIGAVLAVFWVLWGPLVPALGVAEDLSLWTRTKTENGTLIYDAVTLLDLLMGFLYIAAAVFAVRNIGGLLEVCLFEPFSLDAAARYAIASITRYAIVAIAIVSALSRIGANWSELQWIIAALGVGLGFGLQEIVANFVSGLIILFERPIRVGDVVSIGDLRGTVRSIRIRATTITDFDNRQVILPNKTIITENVTNWTLDDNVTRLLLRVGVAYGSDIEAVRDIILDTVSEHPDVLDKPRPTVFFMAHGDSSLQFEVRFFVGSPIKRLPTTHALNAAINASLRENGIQIPFPQSDVHVSLSATQEEPAWEKPSGDVEPAGRDEKPKVRSTKAS